MYTGKDFTKMFYFIQQNKEMPKEQRWLLLSLMSYQGIAGIYNDEEKIKPFTVYFKKFSEIFDISINDFLNLANQTATLDKLISYGEEANEKNDDRKFNVVINWDNIESLRTDYISRNSKKSSNDEITNETVLKVLKMIQEGKISLK